MDPLSVTASVVGLLAAAGKIAFVLSTIRSSLSHAPQSVDQLLSLVRELKICFSSVHNFLIGLSLAPKRRINMIQVEDLVITLTESVLTFSELEALVSPYGGVSGMTILERLKFSWDEDGISSIMQRLDRHKSSLSLMLNIIQWYVSCLSRDLTIYL